MKTLQTVLLLVKIACNVGRKNNYDTDYSNGPL